MIRPVRGVKPLNVAAAILHVYVMHVFSDMDQCRTISCRQPCRREGRRSELYNVRPEQREGFPPASCQVNTKMNLMNRINNVINLENALLRVIFFLFEYVQNKCYIPECRGQRANCIVEKIAH